MLYSYFIPISPSFHPHIYHHFISFYHHFILILSPFYPCLIPTSFTFYHHFMPILSLILCPFCHDFIPCCSLFCHHFFLICSPFFHDFIHISYPFSKLYHDLILDGMGPDKIR